MAVTGVILVGFVVGPHGRQPPGPRGRREDQPLRRAAAHLDAPALDGAASCCSRRWCSTSAPRSSSTRSRPPRGPCPTRRRRTASPRWRRASMIWSGYALGAFIVFHILHFTTGTVHPDFIEGDVFHNVTTRVPATRVIAGDLRRRAWGSSACTSRTGSGASRSRWGSATRATRAAAQGARQGRRRRHRRGLRRRPDRGPGRRRQVGDRHAARLPASPKAPSRRSGTRAASR